MRLLFSTSRGLVSAHPPRYKEVVGRREGPPASGSSPGTTMVPWPVAEGTPVWDGRCRHVLGPGPKTGRYALQIGLVVAERSFVELPMTLADLAADPTRMPASQRPSVSTTTPTDHAVATSGATMWAPVVYSVNHSDDNEEGSAGRKKGRRGTGMERLARLVSSSLAGHGSGNGDGSSDPSAFGDDQMTHGDHSMLAGVQVAGSLSTDRTIGGLPRRHLGAPRDTSQPASDNDIDTEADGERGLAVTEDEREGEIENTENEVDSRNTSGGKLNQVSKTRQSGSGLGDSVITQAKSFRVVRTVHVVLCKKEKEKDRGEREKAKEHRSERERIETGQFLTRKGESTSGSAAASGSLDVTTDATPDLSENNRRSGVSSNLVGSVKDTVMTSVGVQTDVWDSAVLTTPLGPSHIVLAPISSMQGIPLQMVLLLFVSSVCAVVLGVVVGVSIGKQGN
ncbi:hypothetical protein HDU93_001919 [Gonapodya sp. JEL0774]|nr:hypothetical protein HDU93_001919 [Gonapodya sp. JEL0774]